MAAGSCSTLGQPASHLGAAWRLWRLLHSSGPLQSLFRESTLVPDARSPNDLHGVSAFSYGGFSFMLVDPWPEYWAENWYRDR